MGCGSSLPKIKSRHSSYLNRPVVYPAELVQSTSSVRKPNHGQSLGGEVEDRLRMLPPVFRMISRQSTLGSEFAHTLEYQIMHLIQARFCRLYISHPERQSLVYFHNTGQIEIPNSKGIVGSTYQSGKMRVSCERQVIHDYDENVDGDRLVACVGDRSQCDVFISIPLVNSDGSVIGVFQTFGVRSGMCYSPEDEAVCSLVVEHASSIMERNQNFSSMKTELISVNQALSNKSILVSFITSVANETDVASKLDYLLQQVCTTLDCRKASIFLVDQEKKEFYTHNFDIQPAESSVTALVVSPSESFRFPIHEGIAGHVYATKKLFRSPNAYNEPHFCSNIDKLTGFKTKSIMCAPLVVDDKAIGVIQVLNKGKGRDFSEEDADFFSEVAKVASFAMRHVVRPNNSRPATSKAHTIVDLDTEHQLQHCTEISELFLKFNNFADFLDDFSSKMGRLFGAVVCNTFVADLKSKELLYYHKEKPTPKRFRMSRGVSGKVASSMEPMFVPYVEQSDTYDMEVDTIQNIRINCCASFPLVHNEKLVGVITFCCRKNVTFTADIKRNSYEQIFKFSATLLKHALAYYDLIIESARFKQMPSSPNMKKKEDTILLLAKSLLEELDKTVLVRKIMRTGVDLMQADRCSLFLLDEDTHQLYSLVFDMTKNDSLAAGEVKTVRFSTDRGIAGYVVTSGEIVNLFDVYDDERFNPEVDIMTGYRTKSMLCLPIFAQGHKIIGVIQFVNKLHGTFLPRDEDVAKTFTALCGISLFNASLYEKALKSEKRAQVALEMMTYHTKPSIEEISDYEDLTLDSDSDANYFSEDVIRSYNFDSLDLNDRDQILVCLQFFKTLGIFKKHRYVTVLMRQFKAYSVNVSYHNFQHAMIVTHSMFYLLEVYNLKSLFPDLELLALVVAALCHDIDHRGRNNAFERLAHSAIAELYEGKPVMEMHHWERTLSILSTSELNILDFLSQHDHENVLSTIKYAILATDVQSYKETLGKVKDISVKGFQKQELEDRRGLMRIMMSMSDIAAIAKSFKVSYRWAERVQEEFYAQGDAMKKLGFDPPPLFDRGKILLPDSQVDFLKFMGIPVYESIVTIVPQADELLSTLRENTKIWEELRAKLKR